MKLGRLRTKSFLMALAVLSAGHADGHPGLHHEIEAVTEKLALAPDSAALLTERGRLYRLDDTPAASLVDLERAEALSPDDKQIAFELGLTLASLGRDGEAEGQLTRYIDRRGDAPAAYAERAGIRARGGRIESAIDDFDVAIRGTGNVDQYLARGRLQESLGRYDDAAAGYYAGLDRTGGAVPIRLALIRVEVVRARYDAALALIDTVMPNARVKTRWLLRRANVLDAAGRADHARDQRRRALAEADRVLSRRATAINLVARARVFLAMNRPGDAGDDLQAALRKSPRFDAARALLSELEQGDSTGRGGDR